MAFNREDAPICIACRWLDRDTIDTELPTCTAFPEGIPMPIWNGGDHRSRIDDEPVTFEVAPGRMLMHLTWLEEND